MTNQQLQNENLRLKLKVAHMTLEIQKLNKGISRRNKRIKGLKTPKTNPRVKETLKAVQSVGA
jgi:hypothetical protein